MASSGEGRDDGGGADDGCDAGPPRRARSSVPASRAWAPATTSRPSARGPPTPSSRPATPSAGTWDLFRYPGIRSDSDMHTLGYSFRPWDGEKRSPTATRSCSTSRTPPRRRAWTATSASTTGSSRRTGRATTRGWHVTAERTDTGEVVHADRRLRVLLQRLLPLRPRLPARLRRPGPVRAGPSSTRRPGPRTSTSPASGSW